MRSLRCRLLEHAAMPGRLRDGDCEFALCVRCGTDLQRIIGSEDWAEVPAGEAIDWHCDVGYGASAVAARMQMPPAPRRRAPRNTAPAEARGQRRARPHRSALIELTGRFVLDSIVEHFRRPSATTGAELLTREVFRSRVQSRRG
jgi:hypothetical protein